MKLCIAAFVTLSLCSAALADNAGIFDLSAPVLAWSNGALVGEGKHVSYEVFPDVEDVATNLVLSALGKAQAYDLGLHGFPGEALNTNEPRTVIVFIGSQLDATDMRGRLGAIRLLDGLLSDATSSLALPYATSKGFSIRETVCKELDAVDIQHQVVGCSAPSTDFMGDLAAALAEGSSNKLHVVLVCSHLDDALKGTNAGLAAEVEQIMTVQVAVDEARLNHAFVYVTEPKPESGLQSSSGQRRSLMATLTGFGPYTACGPLCQTQARWLEGMLAVLFLALASCAGLVCLYVMDTPTRFESPKDTAQPQ